MNRKLKIIAVFVLVTVAPLYAHALADVSDHFELARAAYANHDYQNCIKYAQLAENEFPNSPSPSFHIGLCAERLGKFDVAYNAFARSKAKDPTDPDVHNNLVILAIKAVSIHRAEVSLREFQRKFPSDGRIIQLQNMLNGLKDLRAQATMSDDEIRKVILESYLEQKRKEVKTEDNNEK